MASRLRNDPFGGDNKNVVSSALLSKATSKDKNKGRQLGIAGEYWMAYAFAYLKGYKVARVDHVGIDLIASKPDSKQRPYAISVKTEFAGTHHKYSFDEIQKIADISSALNFTPAVAYILPRRGNDPEVFDFYFMTLDALIQYNVDNDLLVAGIMKNMDANLKNYLALQLQDWKLELDFSNTKDLRKNIDKHPEIEHMEMHFPIRFS